jgi:flavin reductase (DIM6/NTAB) family NADH-FMN oxidoreductase RutF
MLFEPMQMETLLPQAMGIRATYALMISCIAPRPIAWVSTLSPDGVPNLAPFSYFNAGGANPPSVVFSPTNFRDGRPKDTLRNVEATGEFVINIVPYELAERMNETSADFEYGISEFEQVGLTPLPSQFVKPYRVAESPIQMECRLFQIVRHGEGPLAANYVIGEVLCFHVATHLLKEGAVVDNRIADFIGRMGESWYCRATPESMFWLPRP